MYWRLLDHARLSARFLGWAIPARQPLLWQSEGRWQLQRTLHDLASVAFLLGDWLDARQHYLEAPKAAQATHIFTLAGKLHEQHQMRRSPLEAERLAPQVIALCSAQGEAAFTAQWTDGRAMTPEHTLGEIAAQRPTP